MGYGNQANRYTLFGVLFGLCFPVGSVLFLFLINQLGDAESLVEIVRNAHKNPLLFVIDTAPVFLGIFARLAGIRQDRILRFSESLEVQVRDKTESLRLALDDAHRANRTIVHMAEHDSLTGLLNRRAFQKSLDSWIKYASRYKRKGTLMFIDLDDFKRINDLHGHGVGDQYLVACAGLLTSTLRCTDTLSRWGGDEFAAFLPETVGRDAQLVANKIIAAFAQTSLSIGGEPFQLSASIGLSFVPDHSGSYLELMTSADAAMFEAKKAGKNCYRLYASAESEVQPPHDHLQWGARMRRALDNDKFMLLYQPHFNLEENCTEGYEALLRMEDRTGQLIAPGEFLASADRYSLSSAIDFVVMRKAAKRLAPLSAQEPGAWVSVNVSAQTLHDKHFLARVEAILRETPGSKGKLRFEISETTALQNLSLVRDVCARLSQLGCAVILDDFGHGSISLELFGDLSLHTVKLHPSLIRDFLEEPARHEYVKNLTATLHKLGLTVAAKSVEDVRLLAILSDIGLDYAQGFAIGKPLESTEQAMCYYIE